MPETPEPFSYSALKHDFVSSITKIDCEDWNRLAGKENPFTRYEFFEALEVSKCTSKESGWQPHHLVIRIEEETVGILPLFLNKFLRRVCLRLVMGSRLRAGRT